MSFGWTEEPDLPAAEVSAARERPPPGACAEAGPGGRAWSKAPPRHVPSAPAASAAQEPTRGGRLKGKSGRGLGGGAGPMAATATAVAAGAGATAGAESAEGPPGPAAALELWLSE